MPRIEIELPDEFKFSTDVTVRTIDINSAGHLGWNNMLAIVDEAIVRFWKSLGLPMTQGKRISRIMVDAGISYKAQVFYGQTLRIDVAVAELNSKGFDLVFRITDADSGAEAARAKTGFLCFDYDQQKVVRIPEEWRARFLP